MAGKIKRQELSPELIAELDNTANEISLLSDKVNTELDSEEPIAITIPQGVSIVHADHTSRVKDLRITGRTLVNLLGRYGNCEDDTKWIDYQGTHTLDTTNKTIGNSSIKVIISTGSIAAISKDVTLLANRYYIALADVKNGNATNVQIALGGVVSSAVMDSEKFNTAYLKVTKTADTPTKFEFDVVGSAGQYGYVDAMRLYEITADEYDALDTMTADEIAAKYPYVDDMKHVNAVYAINPGKNLLPPEPADYNETGVGTGPYLNTWVNGKLAIYNGSASYSGRGIKLQVIPGLQYVMSWKAQAASDGAAPRVGIGNTPNGIQYTQVTNAVSTTSVSFTPTTSTLYIRFLRSGNTSNNDPAYFWDLQLELGSVATPFEPQKKSYMFLPDCNLRSNVDGSVHDQLYMDGEGKLRVVRRFKEMVLDGSLPWVFNLDWSGYKEVRVPVSNAIGVSNYSTPQNSWFTKYDGKILQYADVQMAADRGVIWNDGYAYISIADTDSGWGENYTPIASDIQRYFNGWIMCNSDGSTPYSGSGTRYWKSAIDGSGLTSDTNLTALSMAPGYTPYRLMYQLAQSIDEPVTSEGELMLHDGDNQIEVGTGVVVREATNPKLGSNYDINNKVLGSQLKYRVNKRFAIYKNQVKDLTWIKWSGTDAYGNEAYANSPSIYDQSAAYSVTYFALDTYTLGIAPLSMEAEYAPNIKETVDDLVRSMTEAKTALSVLTNTKAQKQKPQWIEPTLLNAITNFDPANFSSTGYMKDEFGVVHIKGLLMIPTTTPGTVIFILPPKYRPSKKLVFDVACGNGIGGVEIGRVDILTNGVVQITNIAAANDYLSLDGISFRAEQ